MSKVIGIVQLKGGAGRSTVATNLAAVLARTHKTALVDCDIPQGTSASWYSVREQENKAGELTLETAQGHQELLAVLDKLESYEYVILDAPPRIAEVTRVILMVSDLLLVPLGASAAEIWATTDLLDTIEEAEKERPQILTRIVWNKYRGYTKSAQELTKAVKKELKVPALVTRLGYRVAYSEALARGLSAAEWSDKSAREEVQALGKEVARLLKG